MPDETPPPYTLPEGTMVENNMPKDHGTDVLYSPEGRPDLVARIPFDVENQYGHELTGRVTDALFDLQENYGINFAGIGNTVPEQVHTPDGGELRRTFIHTSFVDGVNMYSHMGEVPIDVLTATFDTMIRYYEDAAKDTSGKLRFTELSLAQCVYGRQEGDEAPKVYAVDIGPSLGSVAEDSYAIGPPFSQGVEQLGGELLAFKRKFPMQNIDALVQRMQGIGQAFSANVPHYH